MKGDLAGKRSGQFWAYLVWSQEQRGKLSLVTLKSSCLKDKTNEVEEKLPGRKWGSSGLYLKNHKELLDPFTPRNTPMGHSVNWVGHQGIDEAYVAS